MFRIYCTCTVIPVLPGYFTAEKKPFLLVRWNINTF